MYKFQGFLDSLRNRDYFGNLSYIQTNSYVHPNGFKKVVFPAEPRDCEEYRVHFWPSQGVVTDIHNHTSDFCSLVVKGELIEEMYQKIEGDKYTLYRCSNEITSGCTQLSKLHRCDLMFIQKQRILENQCYDISCDTFHRVCVAANTTTVSLVKQMKKERSISFVAKERRLTKQNQIFLPNTPLAKSELELLLDMCYEVAVRFLGHN